MTWDRITVGGPFFNGAWSFERWKAALLEQDFPLDRIDVLLVNHNSSDETLQLMDTFYKEHGIKFHSFRIHTEPREAPKDAEVLQKLIIGVTNTCLDLASELDQPFLMVESDSIMGPSYVRRMWELMNKGYGIASGWSIVLCGQLTTEWGTFVNCPQINVYFKDANSPKFYSVSYWKTHNPAYVVLSPVYWNTVVDVDAIGTGCICFSPRVLRTKKMRFQWDPNFGHDLAFTWKAVESGEKLAVDFGLFYEHLHYHYERRTYADKKFQIIGFFGSRTKDLAFMVKKLHPEVAKRVGLQRIRNIDGSYTFLVDTNKLMALGY